GVAASAAVESMARKMAVEVLICFSSGFVNVGSPAGRAPTAACSGRSRNRLLRGCRSPPRGRLLYRIPLEHRPQGFLQRLQVFFVISPVLQPFPVYGFSHL